VLDGRDTPPRFGLRYVAALERDLAAAGVGRIASVIGRYWAMDRDKRWERVQRAYELFVHGKGERAATARAAVETSYAREQGDEFVEPFAIGAPPSGHMAGRMEDGDGLLCFNFRADRMREICAALGLDDFDGFERGTRPRLDIVTMTQVRADFPFAVAFAPVRLEGLFGDVVSAAGLLQKRMAETEKYAHVTFFFSGGCEEPVAGETRVLVPSPKVATYDLQPQMSAPELCDAILASLREDRTDVYVINFANADMVGHTGIYDAAVQAVATIDACLQRIVPEVTRRGGAIVITADHGNAELMWDAANDMPHTAHTTNPVPIIVCAEDVVGAPLRPMGTLADVVPTLCDLTGIEKSSGMDGVSLLE
jgi:2,3-bisphosphoglycerate-independent phosphoglycerate mutase